MDDPERADQEAEEQPATEEPVRDVARVEAGIPWGAIALMVWAVALIVFAVQNAEDTPIRFLAWEGNIPVALLVMVTALVTLVLTAIGSAFYRRSRRKRRRMSRALRSNERSD